jgi:hypothetical protein
MENHKHSSHLKGKFWQDREIVHAVDFPPNGTFKAFYAAENHLKELGYCVGSMCSEEPIGFAYDADYVAKWYNLSRDKKNSLDGVIIPEPEFREGGATVIFFTPPKY